MVKMMMMMMTVVMYLFACGAEGTVWLLLLERDRKMLWKKYNGYIT